MANNLVLLAAATAALLLYSAAAVEYKTIVTTTVVPDDEVDAVARPVRGCREEVRKQDWSGCESYMSEGSRRDMERCCRELEKVDDRCEREAMREIMQSQGGEGDREEMMERARMLRQTCGSRYVSRKVLKMITN